MNRNDAISRWLEPGGPDAEAVAALVDEPEAQAIAEELGRVRGLLDSPELWEAPPDRVGDAIFATIDAERAADEASSPGLRLVANDGGPAVPSERSPKVRSFLRTALPTAVAAAVIAFVLFAGSGTDDTQPSVEVALAGSELAPDAVGTVGLTETAGGLRVQLDVDRLPPPAEGSYYQAWMIGDTGVVAVGTFHGLNDGKPIVLWSGVAVEQYPVFAVTLEPDDGDPAPSTEQVLIAQLRPAP